MELWPCIETLSLPSTFLHEEVVAAVNKMLTDKCITCQKISGHDLLSFHYCIEQPLVREQGYGAVSHFISYYIYKLYNYI